MCFSATASFGAGILLTGIGVAAIKSTRNRKQLPLSLIPLVFGAQQITEGFLWLALSDPAFSWLENATTLLFLFFAQVAWPVWVPFAILKFETDKRRKQVLLVLTWIGALVSAHLAWCLVAYHVEAEILGMHISYIQHYPEKLSRFGGVLYMVATIIPPFLSSARYMWLVGVLVLVSYIITTIFYTDYIVSVWCFFASIISAAIFLVIRLAKNCAVPHYSKTIICLHDIRHVLAGS